VRIGQQESGIASWYGVPYHGRRAANGEVYDMRKMTAAHRTLPFGTWVKVLNETNGLSVEVRITDRGPFVDDRVIDLSRAAAERIRMIGPGLAKVRLTVIETPPGEVDEKYGVQVAALPDEGKADQLRRRLSGRGAILRRLDRPGEPTLWRVLVGRGTREEAVRLRDELREELKKEGYRGFVVRLDTLDIPTNAGDAPSPEEAFESARSRDWKKSCDLTNFSGEFSIRQRTIPVVEFACV
jgi:rare lipoprotein A